MADAEKLPFEDESFDVVTMAFGIRNCTNVDHVISEAYRVLRAGGVFHCLEFSNVPNPLLRTAYDWYSFNVIPVMGQLIAGDWNSYQYLVESIRMFPDKVFLFVCVWKDNAPSTQSHSLFARGLSIAELCWFCMYILVERRTKRTRALGKVYTFERSIFGRPFF